MPSRTPRDVRTLLPAGSLFYARLADPAADLLAAIEAVNNNALGPAEDQALGRGRLAAGIWPEQDNLRTFDQAL